MKPVINKGDIFGKLTIVSFSHYGKKYSKYYKCICKCGNIKSIRQDHLRNGDTVSCGCFAKEQRRKSTTTHGMATTRFRRIYKNLYNRCNYKKYHEFHYYGGRGIQCEWKKFEDFRDDMYESYLLHEKLFGEKDTTIDRIDVNGNYCKENCRWATCKEQAYNKRKNIT